MENYASLAPAHNPPYLEAIYMFRELLPNTNLVGVFEPGFHINIPEYAYWRLLGAGESASAVIQQALDEYWKQLDKKQTNKPKTTMRLHQI